MQRTWATVILAGAALLIGTEVASGQEILIIPQKPTLASGATLYSYNVNGSFTMSAGTNLSKVLVTLQVKQGAEWFNVQLNQLATAALSPTQPGAPEAGNYSITISDNYDRMKEYRVNAVLYKKKMNGTNDPVSVKTSLNADVPRN